MKTPPALKLTKELASSRGVILLAVTGMSPAVLTETVWALAHQKPAVIPNRVVVITTSRGKDLLERELFTPVSKRKEGLWQLLRKELLGTGCESQGQLTLDTIRVITAPNHRTGRREALEDFRTSAENAAIADFLLEQVRGFVETPGVQLITSIAGGRKTLGALLYACMSLLGRETDRLTHVLVDEPFDNPSLSPRFYFPTQPMQGLAIGGKTVIAKNARIDLGDIPFVPLRNLFERDVIKKPCSFTELVNRCKKEVDGATRRNVKLTIWRSRKQIEVGGVKIATSPMQQVLMLFLADPATAPARKNIEIYKGAIDPLRQFAITLRSQRPAGDDADWRLSAKVPDNFTSENVTKLLNELKDKLEKAGPDAARLDPLLPTRGRFSLDLPPTAITIRD